MGTQLLVDSLKTALTIHLLRHYCATQPKLSSYVRGLSYTKLSQVKAYIDEYMDRNLTLVELGAIAQLSPYHFARLFQQSTGTTPHQYVLQCRIKRAQHLLRHSSLNLAEIAIRVGFCDQSHLTRCFKRFVGVTAAVLTYLKSKSNVAPDRIGVTGFCLGGGLTFSPSAAFRQKLQPQRQGHFILDSGNEFVGLQPL